MTEKEIEVGDIVMDKMTGEFIRIESVSGKGAFDKDLIKIGITTEKLSEMLRNSQREHEAEIKEIEEELDSINGWYGNKKKLCIFCGANTYDAENGIKHKKDCLILKLRKTEAKLR